MQTLTSLSSFAWFGMPYASAYRPLWLVHVVAACTLIGYLPATRLVHTCATPVGRLMNSQTRMMAAKKIGVLGGLMSRSRTPRGP